MDPHSFIQRAEAQRWLGIAEKLLMSHDLVGSKTFAIRARESDSRLEAADQILAIADTLLAAEKRVVGNNGAHQPDYYAILQLVRFVQDTDHIASQYRRLAVLLNPHQNRFPYSDQAFQLVNDAWAVLSNPMRKSMYDSDLDYPPQQQMNTLGFNLEQQHHHQQQQPHNFFSINHMGGGHEQELPEQQQSFQSRLHQSHQQQQQQHQQQHQHQQLQQHNFLSQPNPVRPLPVREQEHMYQHREQEQLFQVTSPPHHQSRPSPQPSQSQSHIQSPPATPQPPFSWPQASQLSEPQHQYQVKQEPQHHYQFQVKQEQQLKQEQLKQQQLKQEQLKQQQLQQEQLKQQQLQQEQLKQQQLQEEQRKQQQMLEEQRKQQMLEEQRKQQMLEEQRKQQMLEEQRKQQQLLEEQRKQQQLLEEQRKQQQLLEEQRKQQQLLEEQRKKQQLLEEQRKQQQMLEEQRKQQQLLEEQRKQQQLQEEQRKQQQILEEQRKQQQLQEEQRKQQQLQEEQRKQQQMQEEQRKQQQLQEEQRKQQQLQQEQLKQQQQESVKHSADPVQLPSQVNSNNGVREEETETEAETEAADDSPTFWTACPYCFYMYEYPRVYVECTLRCDHCKRAFQAVRVASPPPIIEGQDACFYCWGFFPLGLSMSHLQNNSNKGTNTNWTPFSSLHNASNNAQNHLNELAAPKANPFVNKSSGPRIYVDDITDVFIGVSEPSSDSDTEWGFGTKKQKLKRMDKGFKERIQVLALRAIYTGNGSVKNLKHGIPVQEGVKVPTLLVVETNKNNGGSYPRKMSDGVAKELGKLDLNVEFDNNEGEEIAPRRPAGTHAHGQGEGDNDEEGIEFFEGLDEYLSSFPVLSIVNEEKVKVA